jgi:carbonic anhydrase
MAQWNKNEVFLAAMPTRKSNTARKAGTETRTAAPQEQIWDDLMAGNHRFVVGRPARREYLKRREKLAGGQTPKVVILGCSDSRVSPELIFDQNLGDLFVVRSAGNVADFVCRGSIEFALAHLASTVLVVLGHTGCGAVQAACSGEQMPSSDLKAIVDCIRRSCIHENGKSASTLSVEANVWNSAAEIVANSAIVRKRVQEGVLLIVPAIYDMKSGEVVRLKHPLGSRSGRKRPLVVAA